MKERHGVDLKVPVQNLRLDFQKIAPSAAHGIMDQHRKVPQLAIYRGQRRIKLKLVGYVTGIGFGVGNLALERGESFGIASQHGYGVTASRESPGDGGACPWANAGHYG